MQINDVHYQVEDEGNGAPLVLLHGFTGSAENWRPVRPALSKHFRTITIDLLGHGRTESPANPERYRMELAAEDIAAVLQQLGAAPAHLLGYSMGGRLALYVALTYPTLIRTIILESASPGLRTAEERQARIDSDEALAQRIEIEGLEAFATYWSNLPLFATQSRSLRERLHRDRLNNNATGLANSLRGMGTGVQPSLWDRLSELVCPTLLIVGEHDSKFSAIAEQMAAQIASAQVATVPNAGHTVHAEQPEAYTEIVMRFLLSTNECCRRV